MKRWQPNIGSPPERSRAEIAAMGYADDPERCPAITHVFVELRNEMRPQDKWPVSTGRQHTTRWTLQGHPFDIVAWIEA